MRTLRPIAGAALAAGVLLFTAIPADADNIQNDVETTGEIETIAAGASTAVGYRIRANNGDGENGCNASPASPVTVTIVAPAAVSASPGSLSFSTCGDTFQFVTFSSAVPGNHEVTVSWADSGPGTYNESPAAFTLRITPPSDTTPPVITRQITGTAGTNGWYTSDVSVAWTVTDAQSPVVIDSGCGTQNFTTETAATASSCVAHSAGGSASDSVNLKIDKTGPTAGLSPSGTAGQNDWFTSNVSVTTSGTDSLSNPVTCTAPQELTAETTGTAVNGSCTNDAGLTTDAAPITVKIDKTGPTATLTPSGTPGTNGWFISDVVVSVDGEDGVSGGVTCQGGTTLTNETTGTEVSGSCTNDAGLTAPATPITVKIDQSNPTAALVVTSGLLSNGWYTSPVTVATEGSDTISDPVACTAPQHFADDTTGVTVNGSCTNDAGLTEHAQSLELQIDTTPPTNVELTASGTQGANGWFTDDVTVSTTGEDATSGATCTADQLIDYETASVTVNGSCTNGAGLTTHAAPITVKLDKSGPTAVLTPSGTGGTNGWFISDVEVSIAGVDDLSGGVTCQGGTTLTNETTGTEVTGSCTNDAGLTTDADPITVKIDKSKPTADLVVTSGTLSNGWYTTPVTVATEGSDDTSAPVTCTAPQQFADDTTGVAVYGSCTNDAGLTQDAEAITVRIDQTPPAAITFAGGPSDGGSYYFGDVPAAPTGCTAEDATSGFDSCAVTGYDTSVGTHTMTATARDNAGNEATATRTYTVRAWEKTGFYQPVDMGGVLNVVRNGSTVPLKFEAFAGATELTDVAAVDTFTVRGIVCPGGTAVTDDIEFTTTGGTSLRYDTNGGQFVQNWQTPRRAGACYRVIVTFDDGGTIAADFRLK